MVIDIKTVVKELLKKHPYVILPKLGGFVSEYTSARVDADNNTFSPPEKRISFNSDLANDGGLILSYLQQQEGLTDVESQKILSDFVADVWRRLEHGLEEHFPHIGTLKLNEEKEIEFRSQVDENLLLDSYGFEAFKYSPSAKQKTKPTMEGPKVKKPSFSKALILIIGIPVLITYGVYFYLERDPVPFRGIFGVGSNEEAREEFDLILNGEEGDTAEIKDNGVLTEELDKQTLPENALNYTEEQNETESTEESRYAGMTEFHIVAGSFKKYENAQSLQQKLRMKGFDPTILDKQNGFYRVAIKSFDNRNVALQEFNRLRSQHRDLKLWLLSM